MVAFQEAIRRRLRRVIEWRLDDAPDAPPFTDRRITSGSTLGTITKWDTKELNNVLLNDVRGDRMGFKDVLDRRRTLQLSEGTKFGDLAKEIHDKCRSVLLQDEAAYGIERARDVAQSLPDVVVAFVKIHNGTLERTAVVDAARMVDLLVTTNLGERTLPLLAVHLNAKYMRHMYAQVDGRALDRHVVRVKRVLVNLMGG